MKNGEFKIDKGIPIPAGRSTTYGGVAAVLRTLKVGDSIFFPGASSTISHAAYTHLGAGSYATRKEEGGYRVWRTK